LGLYYLGFLAGVQLAPALQQLLAGFALASSGVMAPTGQISIALLGAVGTHALGALLGSTLYEVGPSLMALLGPLAFAGAAGNALFRYLDNHLFAP